MSATLTMLGTWCLDASSAARGAEQRRAEQRSREGGQFIPGAGTRAWNCAPKFFKFLQYSLLKRRVLAPSAQPSALGIEQRAQPSALSIEQQAPSSECAARSTWALTPSPEHLEYEGLTPSPETSALRTWCREAVPSAQTCVLR